MKMKKESAELLVANGVAWLVELLYLVSPIDLVPDFIPLLGQIDDLLGLGVVIALSVWSWRKLRGEQSAPDPLPDGLGLLDREDATATGWEAYSPMSTEEIRSL